MTDDLTTVPCSKCQQKAVEVIYAAERLRRGWYCPACRNFMPAIRRERILIGGKINQV